MYVKTFFRIIVIAVVAGFLLTACEKAPEEKTVHGMVKADKDGEIRFIYSRPNSAYPESCTFTTDLEEPDDQLFTVTIISSGTPGNKVIGGLEIGREVAWTATVKGKPLNSGSVSFVHIVNK